MRLYRTPTETRFAMNICNQQAAPVAGTDLDHLLGELQHQLSLLSDKASERLSGKTIWSTPNRSATIYWSWVVTDEGNPVIADPLSIRSNLTFLSCEHQLIVTNRLVYGLAWQREVMDYIERLGVVDRPLPNSERSSRRKGSKVSLVGYEPQRPSGVR